MPEYKVYKISLLSSYYAYVYIDPTGKESIEDISKKILEFYNYPKHWITTIEEIKSHDIPNFYICAEYD